MLFNLLIAFVNQITAAVARLAGEAHPVGISFSVSGAAPELHAGQAKTLAVFFTNFSAELEGCFSWDFIHYKPCLLGEYLNPVRARHCRELKPDLTS
jgi:hypothetical protein